MRSDKNNFQKVVRLIIDVLNVIFGIAAIVLTVFVFINTGKNKWMFHIIFSIGGLMNMMTGIKYLMTDRKVSGIISEVVAVILFVVAYVSYLAIGG